MTVYSLKDQSPTVDPSSWVAPGSHVIGNVILAADVGIWFGATLRGDNELISIGTRSNIQENAVCHTDMDFPLSVGADCTIGHSAIIHGCTIADGSLIGMAAIVLNGARIGKNCLIGAGALITEGKEIPDGSLVMGTPGRVVGQLDDDRIAGLYDSAAGYVAKMRLFKESLIPEA